MGRISKYVGQTNRALVRKLGFPNAFSKQTDRLSGEALRAACADLPQRWEKCLEREEQICASNAAVYIFKHRITDRLARIGRKHPAMTVGLTTALWLCGILPHRPSVDHWMLAEAKHRPIWLPPDVQVHRSRNAQVGAFKLTLTGQRIHVHAPLRATLDCIRFREELGEDAVADALRAVLTSCRVDRATLLEEARQTKVARPLLELLLILH